MTQKRLTNIDSIEVNTTETSSITELIVIQDILNALELSLDQVRSEVSALNGRSFQFGEYLVTFVSDFDEKTSLTQMFTLERRVFPLYTNPGSPKKLDHGLMAGLHLIVGPPYAGKTTYLRQENYDLIIRCGEPAEWLPVDQFQVPDVLSALFVGFVVTKMTNKKVAIDSLSDLVFLKGGTIKKDGISSVVISSAASISNFCSANSIALTATVNPYVDAEASTALAENLNGRVVSIVALAHGGTVTFQSARTETGREKGAIGRHTIATPIATRLVKSSALWDIDNGILLMQPAESITSSLEDN